MFKGPGRLVNVEEIINRDTHKSVLEADFQPVMQSDNSFFQEVWHGAGSGSVSQKILTLFEESGLTILYWPGSSPDIIQLRIYGLSPNVESRKMTACSTIQPMIWVVIEFWYHDEKLSKICSSLVDYTPKQVELL